MINHPLFESVLSSNLLSCLYGTDPDILGQQTTRMSEMAVELNRIFQSGQRFRVFSSPGRTEIGGNHTDHQGGSVLCAAIQQDILAVVSPVSDPVVRLVSEGFNNTIEVQLDMLTPVQREVGRSPSLIRGIAAWYRRNGYSIGGFNAYTTSRVPRGSGLSSSAAFELLIAEIFNVLHNDGKLNPVEKAKASQYAENEFFGKPCGLMDQMACSMGGIIGIDFGDPDQPLVRQVAKTLDPSWPLPVVTHTGGNHASLNEQYASIPIEMKLVAAQFGADRLRDVHPEAFNERLPQLISLLPGRALLRAMHFFNETRRATQEADAVIQGDLASFLRLVNESGTSSWTMLQNVLASDHVHEQNLGLALALSEQLLGGRGAVRVHGGGFAGTIQAFVPSDQLAGYRAGMDACFGPDASVPLQIRDRGACEVIMT